MRYPSALIFAFLLCISAVNLQASDTDAPILIHTEKTTYSEGETIVLEFYTRSMDDLQGYQVDFEETAELSVSDTEAPYAYDEELLGTSSMNTYDDGVASLLVLADQGITIDEKTRLFTLTLEASGNVNNIKEDFVISTDKDHVTYGDALMSLKFSDSQGDPISYQTEWDTEDSLPDFELLGDENMTLEVGEDFEDPGGEYSDDFTMSVEGDVDTESLGEYTLDYHLEDTDENSHHVASRTVEVVDTTPPELTLNPGIDTITKGDSWEDAGVAVTDNHDNDPSISVEGEVKPDTLGTYVITYTATDQSGNTASIKRYVHVRLSPMEAEFELSETTTTLETGTEFEASDCIVEIRGDSLMCEVHETNIDASSPGVYEVIYRYDFQGREFFHIQKVFYIEGYETGAQVMHMPFRRKGGMFL